jgi:hypothetical protein
MRQVLISLLLATSPAAAWEYSPTPVCTLSHATSEAELRVTYDPRQEQPYAIAISRQQAWPEASTFSMRFDGPRGLTITTDRQRLSDNGRTLTVTDRGFGNVLNGLEFNTTATALFGDSKMPFGLDGAASEVQAFRACATAPIA